MLADEYFVRMFGAEDTWDAAVQQTVEKYHRGLLNLDEVAEQVLVLRRSKSANVMHEFGPADWDNFAGAESPSAEQKPMASYDLVVSDWQGFDDDGEQITNVEMTADAHGLWLGTVDDWMVLKTPFLVAVAIGNALLSASPVDVRTLNAYGLEYA